MAGKLVLEDGTGLGGRPITLTYAGGNAGFDQPTGPDQATRTVKTAADGTFSATLEDPADPAGTPQSTETGTITAVTDDYADPNTPADTDNANDSSTTKVVFSQAAAPADSKVTIGGEIAANPVGKPGVAQGGTVTVVDKAGAPVKNTLVTLTVDGQSFFTDGSADPAKKQGDDTGELKSLGQSITVVTDNAGTADFQVAIEKSAEFNDDGLAEVLPLCRLLLSMVCHHPHVSARWTNLDEYGRIWTKMCVSMCIYIPVSYTHLTLPTKRIV